MYFPTSGLILLVVGCNSSCQFTGYKPNFKPPGNIKSAISSTYLSFDNVDMRKVKEGAYSDKDLARAVNFFLMDKLRKEETLIKNICYRLGRNKDPDIGALLAVTESVGLIVTGEHLALPDDPGEHVRFEGMPVSSDH